MTDNEKRIDELLAAFSERGLERPRQGLLQEIKSHIPRRLSPHRLDAISIVVDLRVSRLAAVAAIVVVALVVGSLFGGPDATTSGVYQDGKAIVKYALGADGASGGKVRDVLAAYRESLLAQGKEVVYYGDRVKANDPQAILMHWRQDDDQYGVIFSDFSARTVSGRTLIRLQAHMIKEQSK